MSKTYLGIDLGTSSVKILLTEDARVAERASVIYEERTPEGWWAAVRKALSQLSGLKNVNAIGLSSQVGTYIINQKEVIHWDGPEGSTELEELLTRYPQEVFLAETGMAHPALISYPLPRLTYAKKHFSPLSEVIQPKDMLIRRLCGKPVTDPYSWRGLANANSLQSDAHLRDEANPEIPGATQFSAHQPHEANPLNPEASHYSRRLLRESELSENILPPLTSPWSCSGKITPGAAEETGLPAGTPVYTGLNDFYAALLGMGISKPGDWFDITGTSEHLGVICPSLPTQTDLIASPYLQGAVCYGVTASSGASLDFGRKIFRDEIIYSEKSKVVDPDKQQIEAPANQHIGDPKIQNFEDLRIQKIRDSGMQNFGHLGMHDFDDSGMQNFDDSGMHNFEDPLIHIFKAPETFLADAPIFLPYLNGERAPIFDPSAKGAFYGITSRCTKSHMAYSVLEGVAFSVYHIFEHLLNNHAAGPEYSKALAAHPVVRISGGAGANPLLTYLKAELLQKTFAVVSEPDASALGAVFIAMKGDGTIKGFEETANLVSVSSVIRPDGRLRADLLKRFQLYKDFYASIKNLRRN